MYTHAMNIYNGEYNYYNMKEYVGWLILLANMKKEFNKELTYINMLREEDKYISIADKIKYYLYTEYIMFSNKAKELLKIHHIDWTDIDGMKPTYREYQLI